MKKNFFKKLSFVLAFAMVATTVAPVGTASAAAKTPNLAKRYANVYEGTSYSYGVKDAAGYTVKWAVSGKGASYASLSKASGTKTVLKINTKGAAAAKNAPVVVTAKFYKNNKLVKAAGDAVTVKVSSTAVDITTKADVTKIAAGEVVDFNRSITPANATSVTYWSVTDKDGKATTNATIDATGNFTATELGDYVIVAETKNAKNGKVIAKDTQEVKVVLAITSAAQDTVKKLKVTFNANLPEGVKATDFSIVKDSNNQTVAVDKIKVDGKAVTVETFAKINDGASYTVKYGDDSFSFVASNNEVSSIAISPITIPNNKLTTINVATKDANGVELDSYKYGEQDSNIDFDIEPDDGYTSDSDLLLYDIGDTAKATATYHTGKYDDKGVETGAITTEVTITAVDQSTAIDAHKYTIDDETPDWDDVTVNTRLAMYDNNYYVYFTATDASDNDLTDFTLKSSDDDLLLVGDTDVIRSQGEKDDDTLRATVRAVDDGTAYVLVQNDKGNTVMSLPVTIVAERKAKSVKLDNATIELSNSPLANQSKKVDVNVYDQFGEELDDDAITSVECISAPSRVDKSSITDPTYYAIQGGDDTDKVEFYGAEFTTTGTYKFRIKASGEDITRDLTVKIVEPKASAKSTYKLALSDSSLDMKYEDIGDNNKTVTIDLAEYKDTIIKDYVDFDLSLGADSIVIKDKDGDTVTREDDLTAVTGGVYTVSGHTITYYARYVDDAAGVVSKGKTGRFTVEVKVDKDAHVGRDNLNADLKLTTSFKVDDNQKAVTFGRDKTESEVTSSFLDLIEDAFTFYYAGNEIDESAGDLQIFDYKISSSAGTYDIDDPEGPDAGKSYNVKEVKLYVLVYDKDDDTAAPHKVPVTVTVGKSVYVK